MLVSGRVIPKVDKAMFVRKNPTPPSRSCENKLSHALPEINDFAGLKSMEILSVTDRYDLPEWEVCICWLKDVGPYMAWNPNQVFSQGILTGNVHNKHLVSGTLKSMILSL